MDAKIQFHHNGKSWVHEFNVKKSDTIAMLKKVMLLPNGTRDDADKFELQKHGRRLPDYVSVKAGATYDFCYLGLEEGKRRAKEDEANEEQGDTFWESDEDEAQAWTVCTNHDLPRKGDIDSMEATDIKAVKSRAEQFGYSGFAMWKGMAYFKKLDKQLTKKDLDFKGKNSGVIFYIYNPQPIQWKEKKKVDKPAEPPRAPVQQQAAPPQAPGQPGQPQKAAEPPRAQVPPRAQEPPKPQKPAEPASDVEVTVRHAMPEMESQITVKVSSDCTIMDVRRAVMAALNEKKLSEVKLVRKAGRNFTSLDGNTPLGGCREFLCMGRSLQRIGEEPPAPAAVASPAAAPAPVPASAPAAAPPAPAAPPKPEAHERKFEPSKGANYSWAEFEAEYGRQYSADDMLTYWHGVMTPAIVEATPVPTPAPVAEPAEEFDITITIDRAMGFQTQVTGKAGSTLASVWESLMAMFEPGMFSAEDWLLGVSPKAEGQPAAPLPMDTVLTREHSQLDLISKNA